MLSLDLLQRLEQTLAEHAPLAFEEVGPGLSEDELETATRGLDLTLPAEARLWWGWRVLRGMPIPRFEYLPLTAAIENYELNRKVAHDALDYHDDPATTVDSIWPAHWLPFLGSGGSPQISIDCGDDEVSPVHYSSFEVDLIVHGREPWFASVGELVQFSTEVIENGGVRHDGTRWRTGDEAIASRLHIPVSD